MSVCGEWSTQCAPIIWRAETLNAPVSRRGFAFNPSPRSQFRHIYHISITIPHYSLSVPYTTTVYCQFRMENPLKSVKGCEIVLGIFFEQVWEFCFGFLGWYHLPSVCNCLELEFVILHGICNTWACSPSILHGIYYMWACSPSILYGICHILACSPSILHGISYMWACSPSNLYGICHILACSPSILHGMFYMWACSPKYLQMRKHGIR